MFDKKKKTDTKKLALWQSRRDDNASAYTDEFAKMNRRESLYLGDRSTLPVTELGKEMETAHVRNICMELIEAQVSSEIPMPKVTAMRKQDEALAKTIEDMLRNEVDRMPFEIINDMMSRTVPIQGGACYLLEWDNDQRTHYTVGELNITALHPKMVIPQDGVYSSIEDMDYIILRVPQTKGYIYRQYGVDVSMESESEPDIKGLDLSADSADDLITQYIAYYRNDDGGIGKYSWVNDVQLEDIEDYQARRLKRCAHCGAVEPLDNELEPIGPLDPQKMMSAGQDSQGATFVTDAFGLEAVMPKPQARKRSDRKVCPYCGSEEWTDSKEDYEEIYSPITRRDGSVIPGMTAKREETGEYDEMGNPVFEISHEPTKIPFYKPDIYPVILHRNVSVYGRFLGSSDIDAITDQQNTTNRASQAILDKIIKSGSYMILPPDAKIQVNEKKAKVVRPENAAAASMIGKVDLTENIEYDLAYLAEVYEEARQTIGITDSYQGRTDRTATSGKAKEFAAAQSAGRLESKRVMKEAAYAQLYEAMFKFKLAYADEPRAVLSKTPEGETAYDEFNRYDFLELDNAGEWVWNDRFLFSCDTSTPLANNREAMWQETRANFQSGAFGDPANPETLIMFWTKMEMLHYPGASETKAILQKQIERQQMMAMQQQMQMQQMTAMQQEQGVREQVIRQAQADAERDARAEAEKNRSQQNGTGKRASGLF